MSGLDKWIKIRNEEYKLNYPPDFLTHLNYVSCLNDVSKNISISTNLSLKSKLKENKALNKKITLIKLTLESIDGEMKTIVKNPEYAELCVSWISVKSYYLIYNMMLIVDFLISGNEFSLNSGHIEIMNRFKKYLERKILLFCFDIFNINHDCSAILKLNFVPGTNIKINNPNLQDRCSQILKKLLDYKLDNLKRSDHLKNFRSNHAKEIKERYIKSETINLLEFFYWYRIKANYRDLEFLNKDLTSDKFEDFYQNYFELTGNFYKALRDLINSLSMVRFNKEIL